MRKKLVSQRPYLGAEENGQPKPTGGAERTSNGAYHNPHEGLAALERWFLSK